MSTCEVWGLFKHLVPQDDLSRSDVNKQRQVMIPDFRVQISSATGQTETMLAELKFSSGREFYKPGVRQRQFRKGVNRRADLLMEEYRKKADEMDRLLGEEGQGRVRRRLDEFGDLLGLVFGQFGEASDDVHQLVEHLADSRIALLTRRGVIVGQLRRQLSTAAVRAGSQCLLDRMHQCGDGAALATRRREYHYQLEERMREDRELQWLTKLRGAK